MAARGHVTHGLALGVFFVCLFIHPAEQASDRPHILFIVADDMGWNDVGFRDSEMYTPNIDKMASEGMVLNYSYMQAVCTPSRAAFLTGVYPFRMGLQHSVLSAMQNASVPLKYEFFPQLLQRAGYKTHMVGKWHLGFCNYNMTPTHRGFHTFYGMYNGKGTTSPTSARGTGTTCTRTRGPTLRSTGPPREPTPPISSLTKRSKS